MAVARAALVVPAGTRHDAAGSCQPLRLTILYETGDVGWIIGSVPEVPKTLSQGRAREEAPSNAIDAIGGILELRFERAPLIEPGADTESLELVTAA